MRSLMRFGFLFFFMNIPREPTLKRVALRGQTYPLHMVQIWKKENRGKEQKRYSQTLNDAFILVMRFTPPRFM